MLKDILIHQPYWYAKKGRKELWIYRENGRFRMLFNDPFGFKIVDTVSDLMEMFLNYFHPDSTIPRPAIEQAVRNAFAKDGITDLDLDLGLKHVERASGSGAG